jgi:hypothetical protein
MAYTPPSSAPSRLGTPAPPDRPCRGDRFALRLYDGWKDKTIYTIAGPVTDGIQHNIIITVHPDVPMDNASVISRIGISWR